MEKFNEEETAINDIVSSPDVTEGAEKGLIKNKTAVKEAVEHDFLPDRSEEHGRLFASNMSLGYRTITGDEFSTEQLTAMSELGMLAFQKMRSMSFLYYTFLGFTCVCAFIPAGIKLFQSFKKKGEHDEKRFGSSQNE